MTIEDQLRDSLRIHAERAPEGRMLAEGIVAQAAGRPVRPRRRHSWRAWGLPLMSAAAVGAVVVALVVVNDNRHVGSPAVTPATSHNVATTPPSGATDTTPHGVPSVLPYKVYDLTFVGNDGWALAQSLCPQGMKCPAFPGADILHSSAAHDWTLVATAPFEISSTMDCVAPCGVSNLRFATDKIGYAFGASTFYMTTDGGKTWKKQPGGAAALETLDGNVIRVVTTQPGCSPPGCQYGVQTAGLGSSKWTTVDLPAYSVDMSPGVTLARTGRDAYLLIYGHTAGGASNAESTLLVSHNNGATWTNRGEPCMPVPAGEVLSAEIDSTAVGAGADGSVVVACTPRQATENVAAQSYVEVSTDRGASFARSDGGVFASQVTQLAVADAQNLCAQADTLFCTHGSGWSRAASGHDSVITTNWIGFESATDGRALSDDGQTLWTTHDAGRTWIQSRFTPGATNSGSSTPVQPSPSPTLTYSQPLTCRKLQVGLMNSKGALSVNPSDGSVGLAVTNQDDTTACTFYGSIGVHVFYSENNVAKTYQVLSPVQRGPLVLSPGGAAYSTLSWNPNCLTLTSSVAFSASSGSGSGLRDQKQIGLRIPICQLAITTPTATATEGSSACLTADQALALVAGVAGRAGISLSKTHPYACEGGWAYVNYVWPPPHANNSTEDLHYINGSWTIVQNRIVACGRDAASSLMPPAIFQYGCGN
jgi:hypothetical protein